MLICPKCKNEYQEGFKVCSDCKVDLVEIPNPENDIVSKDLSTRRTWIGITLLLSSVLTYIGIAISASITGSQLAGYRTNLGITGTALVENPLLYIPCVLAVCMFILGIAILFKQYNVSEDNWKL